jgi:hypothetical protein
MDALCERDGIAPAAKNGRDHETVPINWPRRDSGGALSENLSGSDPQAYVFSGAVVGKPWKIRAIFPASSKGRQRAANSAASPTDNQAKTRVPDISQHRFVHCVSNWPWEPPMVL